MKGYVVLDEKGNVISVAYKGPQVGEENEQLPTLNSGPMIVGKQKLVELDISEEYVKKPAAELFRLMQKEVQTKKEP